MSEPVCLIHPEGHSGVFKYTPEQTQNMLVAAVHEELIEITEDLDLPRKEAVLLAAQSVFRALDGKVLGLPAFSVRALEPDDGFESQHDYVADIGGNLSNVFADPERVEKGIAALLKETTERLEEMEQLRMNSQSVLNKVEANILVVDLRSAL